jgi:hypothetical protein
MPKANNFDFEICPPGLSVQAMRNSGYKDAAHAIAELIDNSIQAGLVAKKAKTDIEVLCLVVEEYGQRTVKKIKEIAVYDNASGMTPDVMRIALQFGNGTHLDTDDGIGKFGMGLPNSSISQCRHVDIYSWQNSECYYTYLDLDEIVSGKIRVVPKPEKKWFPKKWEKMISKDLEKSGSLIIWSKLDQLKWRTPSALFENSEFLIGRVYRYFLSGSKASIRLAAYLQDDSNPKLLSEKYVLPNDPLYLLTGTCSPAPFDKKAAFELFGEEVVDVKVNGKKETVTLRFSICTEEPRKLGGSADIGKHAAKNVGISLVRAGRELEMNMTFVSRYDPRERWWGCEVNFEPGLDAVFGVTNTKQAATSFSRMDLEEDAKSEGMSAKEFTDHLNEQQDPRVIVYQISNKIDKQLSIIRKQIDNMGLGTRTGGEAGDDATERIGTEAVNRRKKLIGKEGDSDKKESDPEAQRKEELAGVLVDVMNKTAEEAQVLAGEILDKKIKFIFEKAALAGSAFFDIKSTGGILVIVINTNHPASKHLFQLLDDPQDKSKMEVLQALKLILCAWARLEDEAPPAAKQAYEDARHDWGRAARDFIKVSEEWK